jgi:O-antigen biosynthesis protein
MPSWAYFTPYPGCELDEECIENGWSLLDRTHYDRCPTGKKVRFVNYQYLDSVLRGHREVAPKLLCDIIIPSYRNEEFTIKCLNSIKKYTAAGSYRVIWVDNGAQSSARVDQVLEGMDHIYLKLKTNEGFVGAINKGLQISTAPYVCFLNNDTEVTARWLEKLLNILRDPTIAIVGPLTGYGRLGPDSQHSLTLHSGLLPPQSRSWPIEQINAELEKMYPDKIYKADFVAFLCAVIKREVIEMVTKSDPRYASGLDTHYDMGMWDDLDYNLSVRKLGYKTVLALDTCIMHHGRSTFNLIQASEAFNVNALLKKNRAYLDSKFSEREISQLTKM